jgi:O-acetylhomoserine (thiol)-lyase
MLHFRINCRVSTWKKPYCGLQTRAVARWLHDHSLVTWVNYAGLPDTPFYERCQKYLPKDPGAIFTFGIKGGREAGRRFIEAVKLHSHLANVGDAKSLVIHPGSTTQQQLTDEEQIAAGLSPDMIRISVGLENLDDILWDLDQALTASQKDS